MPHLLPTSARRAWVAVLFILAALFLPSLPARAQTAEAFSARNLQVDVSAASVTAARDQALADGQRQALQQVLQRLTAPADWPRLPKVSDKQLQDIVLDVGIDQEKRSAVRYIATLSVRFKPDAVRHLLRNAGIAYAEWRGRPVAVLPVYQSETGPLLWETTNPWRDAWKSGAAQGLVPLVVPQTPPVDQPDAPLLNAAKAASGGADTLAAVSQRYNTPDVVIANAVPQRLEGNKVKIDVTLTGVGPVGAALSGTRSVTGETGEPLDVVMRRLVEDIAKTANEAYKGGNLLQFDHSGSLAVMVPLNGTIADWSGIRDKLVRSTPVRSFEVAAMSKTEASLVLHFVGEQPQLEAVLSQNGLALTWVEDHWLLQNAGARPGGGLR
jgi:hypothetical protein